MCLLTLHGNNIENINWKKLGFLYTFYILTSNQF